MLLSAGGLLAVAVQSAPVAAADYEAFAASAVVYVDDDGVNDPGANDSAVSDPLEDGSREHPFDSIQEGIQAVASGGQVLVAEGTYSEALTIDKNLTLSGGYDGEDWDQPREQGWHETVVDASGLDQSAIRILNVDVTLDWLTISHGNAPAGGGIYCEGGVQTISSCRIAYNTTWNGAPAQAGGDGGGIYALGATISLEDCEIDGNQTGSGGQGTYGTPAGHGGRGGGLFALSSTVEINGCHFSSNATGGGGTGDAGYAYGGKGGDGGALYAASCTLSISTCDFRWNSTGPGGDKEMEYGGRAGDGGSGGAVCLRDGTVADILDCTFDDNRTGQGGNGDASADTTGGAGGHGGAICCESSTLTAQGCAFERSTTGDGGEWSIYYDSGTGDGGGMYGLSSTVVLADCEFLFNLTGRTGYYRYARSSGRGGAACFLESTVTIDRCLFQRNKTGDGMPAARGNGASGRGGALFFDSCPSVQVRNCTFAENGTGDLKGTEGENLNRTGDGGGLAILNSLARVENTLLYGNFTGDGDDPSGYANSSGNGGGVYCGNNTEVVIAGCTIAGNRCGVGGTSYYIPLNGSGGGIYTDATTTLVNTILWANMQHDVVGMNAANVSYCDITDWAFDGVNHNVSANPHFADMANNNYLLRPDSPCIDQGDDAAVSSEGMIDLGGNSRIAGSAVDMGAYEYHADLLPPGNVAELTAAGGDRQVSLHWANPGDADFAGVKILRKEGGYPVDPIDGKVIYNGSGTSCFDRAVTNGTIYYYAAFAYDEVLNYSSGVTAIAMPVESDQPRIIGNTTVFPNISAVANRRAMPFVMNEAGALSSISIYHQGGTGDAILAVYDDAGGRPGTRLGATDSTPINSAEGWQTIALQNPVIVPAGRTIWLAWVFENDPGMRWTEGGPGRATSTATWSDGMPDTFGESGIYNGIYSIYANYGSGPDITPPGNVGELTAIAGDGQVSLSWTNPADTDLASVWVIRKEGDYPVDVADGVVVYAGSDTSCVDSGLTNGTTYYYTIFSCDNERNFSTGATISAMPGESGEDRTIGNTTVFPSISAVANRRAMPFVMNEAGALTSISIYHQGGTGDAILAVYDDAGGRPGTRLGVTDATPINRTAGWQTISLQSPVSVSADETVWLAWVFEDDPGMRWIEGSPGRAMSTATWSDGMPDAFGESAEFGAVYSVYATYATGADVTPPGNVTQFTAAPNDGQIALTWANPAHGDFAGVTILRKEGSSPVSPTDGTVVYDGPGTTHADAGLTNGTKYYYAAFSYDEASNYSAGALASGTPMEGSTAKTAGYTTVFSNVSFVANRRAVQLVCTETGLLTSISIYHQGGTGNAVLAVYADSHYAPGARLGLTNVTPINSGEGWQTIALQTPVAVGAGDWIWLAWVFENDPGMRWAQDEGWRAISTDAWSDGMPSSFGTSSLQNVAYSVYATYGSIEDHH